MGEIGGADDVCAGKDGGRIGRLGGDEDGMDGGGGAGHMVGGKIAGVGSCLVEIGLGVVGFTLEFEDDDVILDKEDGIDAAGLERDGVFEDDGLLWLGIGVGGGVVCDDVVEDFERIAPGSDLGGGGVGDVFFELLEDERTIGEEKIGEGGGVGGWGHSGVFRLSLLYVFFCLGGWVWVGLMVVILSPMARLLSLRNANLAGMEIGV